MKDFKVYIFIASAILVIYLLAEYNRPKPIDWTHSYLKTDKIPFGTYILYNQLRDIFPGAKVQDYREPVYNVIADHQIKKATYLIVCDDVNLTRDDIDKLKDFAKQGNDVFIAATDFGNSADTSLKIETERDYDLTQKEDKVHFLNPKLNPKQSFTIAKEFDKNYFSQLDTTKAVALVKNDAGKTTCIKMSMGKGALYFNTDPQLFTNYSLLSSDGQKYAATVLSYVKNNPTVIWDTYYTLGREGDASLMRVIFQNPALKWAYCITLISLLLYVIYQMKRRQRIIPIIEPLANSSIDFARVVGQVYYEQRNNSNIAQKKAVYILEHIRTRYHLKTNLLNEDMALILSQKSGVDINFLHKLFNQINIVRSGAKVSDNDLIAFNQNIEQFYKQSR